MTDTLMVFQQNPGVGAEIGCQGRCPEGKLQKNTRTHHEQESKWEISHK